MRIDKTDTDKPTLLQILNLECQVDVVTCDIYVIGLCHQYYEKKKFIDLKTTEYSHAIGNYQYSIQYVYSRDLNKNSIKGDWVEVGEVCAMVRGTHIYVS
ncbi:unnamed protein product [Macrosiphum euphorbiae]|uniref:Uncharacterized protein n=1 Tax=Macrosiphum euphorbiae TaxID=13131 RepID=A0AAV0W282_9HEMI|nr:unnamed protein product [Macrosiphum euphorbiae]